MKWARLAAAVLLTALGLAALGALSRTPYGAPPTEGLLRLSWRFRGERIDECRPLTEAEKAALPVHMRRDEVCEGRLAAYRLTVEVDDEVVAERSVLPAGAREDRPLFLFEELPVAPGRRHVRVRFRVDEASLPPSATKEARREPLELEATLNVVPGGIALVTYDADVGGLVLRGIGHAEVERGREPNGREGP